MDLEMPVLDGIEATRRIVEAQPRVAVVVLTSFSDREQILRALDAGAVGYLLKDAEPAELERAVRAAARGEAPLDPRAGRALLQDRASGSPLDGLSEREREVLAMVARGLPNKLIARELAISEKTVKAHLTSVYRTIGVTDRTQAALWAERTRARVVGPKSDCALPHRAARSRACAALRTLVVLLLTGLLVLAAPVTARADDGDEADVRVERSCTARSTVRLRVANAGRRRAAGRLHRPHRTARRGLEHRRGARAADRPARTSANRIELGRSLAAPHASRLAREGHRHRPCARPGRRGLPGVVTISGAEPRRSCGAAADRLRRGSADGGDSSPRAFAARRQPAGACDAARRARPSGAGSTPASPRRTRRRG